MYEYQSHTPSEPLLARMVIVIDGLIPGESDAFCDSVCVCM